MKYIKIIFALVIYSSITLTGCRKEEVASPDACFTINNSETDNVIVKAGTAVSFVGCSSGDFYVLWPGDLRHDYSKRPENLTDVSQEKVVATDNGFVADLKTKTYSYKYSVAGTYSVTWVVSNIGNNGEDVKFSIATRTIVVQ